MAFGSSILGWNMNTRISHKTLTQFTINSQLVAAPSSQSHALLRLGFHPPLLCFFFSLGICRFCYMYGSLCFCVLLFMVLEYKEKRESEIAVMTTRNSSSTDRNAGFSTFQRTLRVENPADLSDLSLSLRKLFHIFFPSKQGIRCVRFLFIFP